ncbi:MAG: hypothetical protein K2I00_10930 [Ruminococcus sp.]|nr:hypothetical protein [Ruminococcus sp.]
MKKSLSLELCRLFHSKALYIAILIGCFFSVWLLHDQLAETKQYTMLIEQNGTIKEGLYYPDSVFNHFIGLDYWHKQPQTLYLLFPVLTSIPYASSYCTDKKSGYLKNLLTKEKRCVYYASKYVAVFFSGFITVFSILIFSLLITMMFYPLLPPEAITASFPASLGNSMFKKLFINHPMIYTLLYIVIDSTFFGAIAIISMVVGMITDYSFVSLVSGTILYYSFSLVVTELKLYTHNPAVYLVPYQPYSNISIITVVLHMLIVLTVCAVCFFIKEAKKDVL